jgi:hypothetical protein
LEFVLVVLELLPECPGQLWRAVPLFSAFSWAAVSVFSCAALSFDFGVALGVAVAATGVAVRPDEELDELVAAAADPPDKARPPMKPPVATEAAIASVTSPLRSLPMVFTLPRIVAVLD